MKSHDRSMYQILPRKLWWDASSVCNGIDAGKSWDTVRIDSVGKKAHFSRDC